jgi:hypothetical protein
MTRHTVSLEMVGKIVIAFVAFVALIYVLNYPGHVVGILQMVIDAAHRLAEGLSHLDPSGGNK